MSAITRVHYEELLSWIGKRRYGVAGTVTFRPSVPRKGLKPEYLTAGYAQSCVSHYLRRLDRAAFGSAGVRKGRRVGVLAVREGWDNPASKNLHYHLALTVPDRFTPEGWADIAHRSWTPLEWASSAQNMFKPMWSDQWLSYIFKTRDKPSYLDAMDYENWRLV
jgi:hypothetical protein